MKAVKIIFGVLAGIYALAIVSIYLPSCSAARIPQRSWAAWPDCLSGWRLPTSCCGARSNRKRNRLYFKR